MFYVCKCIRCRRMFQGTEKNRGTAEVAGLSIPIEVCDTCVTSYRQDAMAPRVTVAQQQAAIFGGRNV